MAASARNSSGRASDSERSFLAAARARNLLGGCQKWRRLRPEMAAARKKKNGREWRRPEMAAARNGGGQKWRRPEMAAARNGGGQKWRRPEIIRVAASRNGPGGGGRQKWRRHEMAAAAGNGGGHNLTRDSTRNLNGRAARPGRRPFQVLVTVRAWTRSRAPAARRPGPGPGLSSCQT
jgi:hypothetical protein